MEKNKVLLTDKVTKENLKSPTFKKWVMRVLCFACILSLALQLAMCVAPMSVSALEYDYSESRFIFQNYLPFSFTSNSVNDFDNSSLQVYYEYNTINHSVSGYNLDLSYYVELVDDSLPALTIKFSDTDTRFVVARDDLREQWYYTEVESGFTAVDWYVSIDAPSLVTSITISANVLNYSGGVAFNEFLNVVNNFLGVTSYSPFVFNNPFSIILKAGTYRFNENIEHTTIDETFNYQIDTTDGVFNGTRIYSGNDAGGYQLSFSLDINGYNTSLALYQNPPITTTTYWADGYNSRRITIPEVEVSDTFGTWYIANTNYNEVNAPSQVYDFTGEYRIFKHTLDINFASTQTVQTYQFDFNIYGGYNADYMSFVSDADEVTMSYAFTDEGSGGLRMMYRQNFGDESGTWLVPRARIIYFQSNPDDPTFQQWLLDNTILVEPESIDILFNAGYDLGFNDGWTNNVIGDTLKAPIDALNGMVLLQTADVTITLGGVIFTMVVLLLLIVFLKKYAGG